MRIRDSWPAGEQQDDAGPRLLLVTARLLVGASGWPTSSILNTTPLTPPMVSLRIAPWCCGLPTPRRVGASIRVSPRGARHPARSRTLTSGRGRRRWPADCGRARLATDRIGSAGPRPMQPSPNRLHLLRTSTAWIRPSRRPRGRLTFASRSSRPSRSVSIGTRWSETGET